jgi:hypothetical protein
MTKREFGMPLEVGLTPVSPMTYAPQNLRLNPLDELAIRLRSLSYGDMVWWRDQCDIDQNTLDRIHRWAVERCQ